MGSRKALVYLTVTVIISVGLSSVFLVLLGMPDFIPKFLALSLSDSINPCTFAVYTMLLIALSVRGLGGRAFYLVGISFISAVYISYYTLGLGLAFLAGRVPLRWAAYFAIAFGAYTVLTGIYERSRVGGKRTLRKLAFSRGGSVVGAMLLGFFVSTTLLPCSAGPYIVYAAIISRSPEMVPVLLALYNAVFILPLLLILLAFGSLRERKDVSRAMVRHSGELSVVSGVLIAVIGFWLLR